MTEDGTGRPLSVSIEDGVLTISIGIGVLARAIETSPDLRLAPYNEETRDFDHPRITDPGVFAAEVARELENEAEDGTTPVMELFDTAALRAIEEGSEGVSFASEEE